ncbi:MAG: hypothetical protein KBT63_12360 [Porticoccaceae bacterium]|nr:hypothetical protein [Porticoccaceae bacterium]
MSVEILREALGWSTVINYGLLLFWFAMFVAAHDWVYRFHGKWFTLSADRFDAIHYSGMAIFKLLIFIFNLTPYLALHIVI